MRVPTHESMRLYTLLGDKCLCPDCFAERMKECAKYGDAENGHVQMDEEMEEVLTFLGYHKGVSAVRGSTRWYA